MSNTTNTTKTAKRIRIAGNAVVLTSALKLDEIKKMEKYSPNGLALIEVNNEEINEVFRISTGKVASITKFGITFPEANKDGYAIATVLLPDNTTDKKAYVKDAFATTIFMLKELEDAVKTDLAKLDADFAKLDEEIEEV